MSKALILLFALLALSVNGQSFEGKITYRNSVTSKLPNITSKELLEQTGNTEEFRISGGDYKISYNGVLTRWSMYINKENRIYTKSPLMETILFIDAGVNYDSILNVTVNKEVIEILGIKCDEVIFTCKSGIQKYYYNQNIGVDIEIFKNHLFRNWYEFLKISKSLPLKTIIENEQSTKVSVAVKVKEMKFGNKKFRLPKNAKILDLKY